MICKYMKLLFLLVLLISASTMAGADPSAPSYRPEWSWPNGKYNGWWSAPDGTQWYDNDPTQSGWSIEGDEIVLWINNSYQQDHVKKVWIEFRSTSRFEQVASSVTCDGEIYPVNGGGTVIGEVITWDRAMLDEDWFLYTVTWSLTPQPDIEYIRIPYPCTLQNIYYSTICEPVPEPSSILTVCMAIAAVVPLIRRRR